MVARLSFHDYEHSPSHSVRCKLKLIRLSPIRPYRKTESTRHHRKEIQARQGPQAIDIHREKLPTTYNILPITLIIKRFAIRLISLFFSSFDPRVSLMSALRRRIIRVTWIFKEDKLSSITISLRFFLLYSFAYVSQLLSLSLSPSLSFSLSPSGVVRRTESFTTFHVELSIDPTPYILRVFEENKLDGILFFRIRSRSRVVRTAKFNSKKDATLPRRLDRNQFLMQ